MKLREHWTDYMAAMLRFCAYRERSVQEVLQKMQKLEITEKDQELLLKWLYEVKALNETRYAESFVNGKLHLKKWGKQKIQQHLRRSGTNEALIREKLKEIDEEEYLQNMRQLIQKKNASLKEEDAYIRKNKIARYLLSKGYESDKIWKLLGDLPALEE